MILINIWRLQKLGKDWQEVNKHNRSLMRIYSISGSQVNWRLGNSIRLRSQRGSQNLNDREDTNRAWENIKENM